MSRKSFIYLGASAGSLIGGYVPALWGAGAFSMTAILTGGLGGLLGIWAAYKVSA